MAKAEWAKQKEARSVRKNETMNSVKSASLSREDDNDVGELTAMFKGL
jgi:hypothetical protein